MWIATFAIIAIGLFPLTSTIVGLMRALEVREQIVTMSNRFGVVVLAVVALGLIIYLQHHFVTAPSYIVLITRFSRVMAILLLILFAMDVPAFIALGVGQIAPRSMLIAGLKLAGGAALLIAARYGRKAQKET
jgi:hypothetical protein